MTDKELLYVKTVAEEHNVTRAAEKLHIAQPSLSYSIRALENGASIMVIKAKERSVGVDTPEDLAIVEKIIAELNID